MEASALPDPSSQAGVCSSLSCPTVHSPPLPLVPDGLLTETPQSPTRCFLLGSRSSQSWAWLFAQGVSSATQRLPEVTGGGERRRKAAAACMSA